MIFTLLLLNTLVGVYKWADFALKNPMQNKIPFFVETFEYILEKMAGKVVDEA